MKHRQRHRGRSPFKALVLLYVIVPNRLERDHVHVVSNFLDNALVSRVNRRICIIVRF